MVAVVDAAGAAAADAAAIAAGIPPRALMQRAGAAMAALLVDHCGTRVADGVLVATGAGNNGGDGWVIAHALHAAGIRVRVVEVAEARTGEARAERGVALAAGVPHETGAAALRTGTEGVLVDALLGTGYRAGEPLRGALAEGIATLRARRARGAMVAAVDLPSALDANDGADGGAVPADLTVTFGTVKRGHLVARALCGRLLVADIGLGASGTRAGDARLASAAWFRATLPAIDASAHKGTRGKVAIVGGAPGMAGAAILAAAGALRSGAGLVRCLVAPASLPAVQAAEPAALASPWPEDDAALDRELGAWADAVLLGPGLGRANARALVERVLRAFRGPVVLDADALNAFAGDLPALAALLGGRAALLTPHPAEFARLTGEEVDRVLAKRFEAPTALARTLRATVLLKGVPTVVADPEGAVTVVAEGTPILATGGAGDVLGGIAATLLASSGDAATAGALAAFAHGRAAAAVSARQVRGYTLEDVLAALPATWALAPLAPRPPVLADLPAVGEGAR